MSLNTFITVGDPERVRRIARHLNKIEVEKQKREFLTLTGYYKDLRLSLISTGIGTDNIDIVFNELDALWNIDLEERRIRNTLKSAKLLRLGTTGSLQAGVEVDQLIFSRYGLGTDGLMEFYQPNGNSSLEGIEQRYKLFASKNQPLPTYAYFAESAKGILPYLPKSMVQGITLTAKGFYAPQGRNLGRVVPRMEGLVERFSNSPTKEWL